MSRHDFSNVRLGDLVKFTTGDAPFSRLHIGKVGKVTPTQFAIGVHRFYKKDGRMVGNAYRFAEPATEDDLAKAQAAQYKKNLQTSIIRWFDNSSNVALLTVAQLETIQSIIKQTPEP